MWSNTAKWATMLCLSISGQHWAHWTTLNRKKNLHKSEKKPHGYEYYLMPYTYILIVQTLQGSSTTLDSHSLTLTHSHSLTHTHSLTLTHTHSHSLTQHSHSLSLTTHTHSLSHSGGQCRLQWPPLGILRAVEAPGATFSFFSNFCWRKEAVEQLCAGLQPSKNRKLHKLKLISREAVVTASALK